jgi:uncharacterized tellurite resistance protein B-like protein
MVIAPRPADMPQGGCVAGDWITRFEARSLDDIRAFGRNSPEDDRAFATVAKLSEINLSIYRTFMQPFVRAMTNHQTADMAQTLNPLRLSYTIFADKNPWMKGVKMMAESMAAARKPVVANNPFLALQTQISDQIAAALDAYRVARDRMSEQMFFGFYGSSLVQALLGINSSTVVRPLPSTSPEKQTEQKDRMDAYAAKLQTGGFDEALTRAVLYVIGADRMFNQRCACALTAMRQKLMHLSLAEFKAMVRDQFFVLQLDHKRAVDVLASLVPEADARKELLKQVQTIVSADGASIPTERDHLVRLSKVLRVTAEKPLALVTSNQVIAPKIITQPTKAAR